MTIDEVIQSRNMAWYEYIRYFEGSDWFLILIIVPIGALLLTNLGFLEKPIEGVLTNKTFSVAFVIVMTIFSAVTFYGIAQSIAPKGWEEEIAEPYYEALEPIKEELRVVSMIQYKDSDLFDITYEIKDENGYLVQKRLAAPIKRELGLDKVVYEYKYIEKDIPHFKEQGKYEEVVNVPMDYEFPSPILDLLNRVLDILEEDR